MISHFFIDRPIFASVLSIVITLAGAIAMVSLPITQYPPIAPPTVIVSINYPGASSQVVADTIGAPVEQQVNGVEGMLYMSSFSANDGSYSLTVTFNLGVDLNTALVMVQNRVALAMPQLPDTVQRQGITIRKKTPNILMVVNFYSPGNVYDDIYLSNYATINVRDELLRTEGVSDITYMGQRDYSVRAWLDPQLLSSRNITASEVSTAIQLQSVAPSAGQVNQPPVPPNRAFQNPLDMLGRLSTPEQFGDIIVKITQGSQNAGSPQIVRLKDVARLELGATNYNQFAMLNGQPTVGLAVFQLPGTNALDVAERIKSKMAEMEKRFPDGLAYAIRHDTTPFIRESVNDVVKTLLEAVALVALVVLLFLQNWRASLIPLIAVPVAIVGTFSVMQVCGFSLNNISLFGLVLSIGIVVDDAIVVVENVEPLAGAGLAGPRGNPQGDGGSHQPGDRGCGGAVRRVRALRIYQWHYRAILPAICRNHFHLDHYFGFQFTDPQSGAGSHPAQTARFARPDPLERLLTLALGWLFRAFNWTFTRGTDLYAGIVGWALRLSIIVLLLYGGLLGLTWWMFNLVPTGFIPQQDQGYLLVNVQLPDSASVQRTQAAMKKVEALAREIEGVSATVSVTGTSTLLSVNSSNFGSMYVTLDEFDQRRSPDRSANAINAKLRSLFAREIREATVSVFGAPPVPGIGTAGGFKLMVEDRGSLGPDLLQKQTDALVLDLSQQKWLIGVFTLFRAHAPQLFMDIDRTKVRSMGVSLDDLNQTLTIYLGSSYVNNFNAFGRYWQVNIQAEGTFRNRVDDLNQIKVRNDRGEMAPLGTLVNVSDITGPVMVNRYNLYAAAPINGGIYPTMGTGQAIAFMDDAALKTLPRSMKAEWTELTLMQNIAGNSAMNVFGLAVLCVFLALAALYESWTLPLAVILVVPMCLLSSIIGVALSHLLVDIFVQIGFVVLVGLACKNAILIVEFAKRLRAEGMPLGEATREASRLRLRPIVMTSLAFILGVVPLVVAQGAGAEMRQSLGTAVFGGMLGVTLFGIFLTPVFFFVIEWLGESPLLAGRTVRAIGSALWGALAGALAALLLWNLEFVDLRGASLIGVVLAVSITVLVQRTGRRLGQTPPAH